MDAGAEADERFQYLDSDLGLALPQLVLAVRARAGERRPAFRKGRVFSATAHQTAGLACHQRRMWATILRPTHPARAAMAAIESHWLGSCAGALATTLDEVVEYRRQLIDLLAVDCNLTYGDFEEALYPIDPTLEHLGRVCCDELPGDLDELIEWTSPLARALGSVGRWRLLILGGNSD